MQSKIKTIKNLLDIIAQGMEMKKSKSKLIKSKKLPETATEKIKIELKVNIFFIQCYRKKSIGI